MTREEAIAFFKDMNECTYGNLEAVEMAIKALETPPNDNWDGYSRRLWKAAYERGKADAEQTSALDKIRAEIERKAHSGQWSDATMYGMLKAVAIIDKYKAESEDKLDGDPVDIDKAVKHYEGTLEVLKGINLEVDG